MADSKLDRQLIISCYKRDVDSVSRCLRLKANVNATFGDWAKDEEVKPLIDPWEKTLSLDIETWTPLMALAASCEYPDPPDDMRQKVSLATSKEVAAMQKAIPKEEMDRHQERSLIVLYILLSHGCRLDQHDHCGATALFKAADKDNFPIVKTLLKFGADPNTKTGAYFDGPEDVTPLHVAFRSQESLRVLLDHGANADAKDSNGNTPADWVGSDPNRIFDLIKTTQGWRITPKK